MSNEKVQIFGATPSPYTQKMISVFRYRHIPYEAFTGFGRTGRNIIFINQKKDDKPKMARDKFARPQLFLMKSLLFMVNYSTKKDNMTN